MNKLKYPELVGHRGNAFDFVENTRESVQSALDLGVHVEVDVHVSGDRVAYVHHDVDLLRIHGVDLNINKSHSSELDLYLWRLTDLVDLVLQHASNATIFVELKSVSMDFHDYYAVPMILEILKPIKDRVVIISFDIEALRIVRQDQYRWSIGLVLPSYSYVYWLVAKELNVDWLFVDYYKLPDDITMVWGGYWKWVSYEIDSEEKMLDVRRLGILTFETKQVEKMIRVIEGRTDRIIPK